MKYFFYCILSLFIFLRKMGDFERLKKKYKRYVNLFYKLFYQFTFYYTVIMSRITVGSRGKCKKKSFIGKI